MRARLNRLLVSFALLGTLTVGPAAGNPAAAASSGCASSSSGGTVVTPPTVNGGRITFDTAVHVFIGQYCPGTSTAGDSSWTPPACWWQPMFTPQELKAFAYANYDTGATSGTWGSTLDYFELDGGKGTSPAGYKTTDGPPYANWNIGFSPGGEWWALVFNEDMMGTAQFEACLANPVNNDGKSWSWVPTGNPGPANVSQPVVTREQVAEYAASIMQLPGSDFQSSPRNGQTVYLPMWVWAGNPNGGAGPYTPQVLKACTVDLDGVPSVCATVTATALKFTIDPGTPNNKADAFVYDDCTISNGNIGVPYNGQPGLPPCGVKYLHSTPQATSYYPSVTVDWSVNWDGTGGVWPKPVAIPGAQHPVTVQEIQTVVGH